MHPSIAWSSTRLPSLQTSWRLSLLSHPCQSLLEVGPLDYQIQNVYEKEKAVRTIVIEMYNINTQPKTAIPFFCNKTVSNRRRVWTSKKDVQHGRHELR
jgi:hypothetical protein